MSAPVKLPLIFAGIQSKVDHPRYRLQFFYRNKLENLIEQYKAKLDGVEA